ncbi:MAG TPA: SAM-dependent chlorinase/fluorinase [Candidatus Limnocylindria bacterium]|nr:SAM-dependent chlorinase/fluorinase [Candidatus Limnocylindria bacterium]
MTLTTDFGLSDPFVGIMKGVIATRAPGVPVIDVSHGIPPQAVIVGAFVLRQAAPYFPAGTVHVAVVDPGVGSDRRGLCVETATGCFVGPDNGVLALAAEAAGIRRIVELTEERFFLSPRSATFHGRDVFAPVAAALATGTQPAALGPERSGLVRVALPAPVRAGAEVHGEVVYVDHFGNLVSNLSADWFPEGFFVVSVAGVRIGPVQQTYAAVAPGAPVALLDSFGLLEIAVRDGRAHDALACGAGARVTLIPS